MIPRLLKLILLPIGLLSMHCVNLTPALPILSEESKAVSWEERQCWETYWLVDPLDGTKEFISRNGEFTVNIALIDNGRPVMGVVYVPVLDILYYGSGRRAHSRKKMGKLKPLRPPR